MRVTSVSIGTTWIILNLARLTFIYVIFNLIVSISTVFAIVTPSTNGRLTLKNFASRQIDRIDKWSRLVSCTATFIDEYFEYPSEISLLLPDVSQNVSDLVEPLMRELRPTNAIYTLKVRLTNVMETYRVSTNTVILLEGAIALERDDLSFVNYCNDYCNFIIALTNLFADKESFLIEAATLVQRMSLQSIFKFAILASVGDSILSAGNVLVRIDGFYTPNEPELLGRCEVKTTAIRWRGLADKTKSSSDVASSTINAAIFNNFPYAFPKVDDKGCMSFGGIEGSMVEEIARNIGVKLNREVIELMNKNMLEKELYLRIQNATSDLVSGGLLWDPQRRTEYTTCYGMAQVVWIVPIITNVSLQGLISPFGAYVWYAIIVVLIIGGLAKFFFIRDITFLDIGALVLGVPIRQPERNSGRIQFISWCLFGFFLTQLYLGSLADQLMSASEIHIDSMEELIELELQVGATKRLADLLQTPDKGAQDNARRVIRDNLIIFDQYTYNKQLLDVIKGRNTSLGLLAMMNLTNIHRVTNIGQAHVMRETVGNYPLALATWQGFPHLNEFNFKIQILVQAGIIEFWSDMARRRKNRYQFDDNQEDETNSTTLDIEDIAPAFLVLIIGYLGGFCLLIIEVIFYPSKIFL